MTDRLVGVAIMHPDAAEISPAEGRSQQQAYAMRFCSYQAVKQEKLWELC